MKKTNNKGFSLVELIIVIAIMAILAGAIAPALIKYIDRSRKSNDVNACKSIKTAFETALANEDVYEALVPSTGSQGYYIAADDTAFSVSSTDYSWILSNISGNKSPKLKYTKKNAVGYVITVTEAGEVKVGITSTANSTSANWDICPDVDPEYQK